MTTPSPYPGLRQFQQDEGHLFFGRETQIGAMLERLEEEQFLAIIGTSGCGKSSLVSAGLIPELKRGFLTDAGQVWRVAQMRPSFAPYDHLTAALLRQDALGPERGDDPRAASILEATLRRGPLGIIDTFEETYLSEGTNLLLVVDNFEDIFRFCRQHYNINDARAFINMILESSIKARSKLPIFIVIIMQSNYLSECTFVAELIQELSSSLLLVPQLTRKQCEAAIVEPARENGWDVQGSLVNRILNSIGNSSDQLPLLQHLMMRIWKYANFTKPIDDDKDATKCLNLTHYENVGSLKEAIAKHAGEIFSNLQDQKELIQAIFRCLCGYHLNQHRFSEPLTLKKLSDILGITLEEIKKPIETFRHRDCSFIITNNDIEADLTSNSIIDIRHECLISQWPELQKWVAEEIESSKFYARLEDASRRWKSGKAALWQEPALDEGLYWKRMEKRTKAWAELYGGNFDIAMEFLEKSEERREQEFQEAAAGRQSKKEFDVFLAHNNEDKEAVIIIANRLLRCGIKPFLDKWHIRPGSLFDMEIGRIIEDTEVMAVFIGSNGVGPWQRREISRVLELFETKKRHIIPVLLPGVQNGDQLLWQFSGHSRVCFEDLDDRKALMQLIHGITGKRPNEG